MTPRSMVCLAAACALAADLAAQAPPFGDDVREFIKIDAPVVVLTHARVIDGTGAPARDGQTLILRGGDIVEVGDAAGITPPDAATIIDLTGKTIMPGFVMVHEHLHYPTGPGAFGQLGRSFSRLYLAGGVTSMRTAGSLHGLMDLILKRRIDERQEPGPWIDATAPYLNGPSSFLPMYPLANADEVRRAVEYWGDVGATSFKAFMNITRAELGAAIVAAHKRGLKVTGHLCAVTYAEATELGIDNLEHGFLASTDFVADKKPDVCPDQSRSMKALAALEETSDAFTTLVKKLVARKVALTSTLTVYETFTPGRPMPPGLDVLVPQLKEQFEQTYAGIQKGQGSPFVKLFPKELALERAFVQAGGLLLAGTDPTGYGGVIPGFSNQRQIELLVEAGFSPVEAIAIGTRNGARYLGREDRIGTIARGKQADLVVVTGDPSARIADIRNVHLVFKQGVGFDPVKLIDSVKGRVGLW